MGSTNKAFNGALTKTGIVVLAISVDVRKGKRRSCISYEPARLSQTSENVTMLRCFSKKHALGETPGFQKLAWMTDRTQCKQKFRVQYSALGAAT